MEDDQKKISIESLSDILNTGSFLEREPYRTAERYEFILNAAKNATGVGQVLAAKFLLQFFEFFPEKQNDACRIAFSLMHSTDENMRVTLVKELSVLGTKGPFLKQTIDVLIQCTTSRLDEEKEASYDQLVQFLHDNYRDVVNGLREALSKEPNERKRKAIFEFIKERMRLIPLGLFNNKEVMEEFEEIYKDELLHRATLSSVDDTIISLGFSLVMDNYDRQQKLANFFVDAAEWPETLPEFSEDVKDPLPKDAKETKEQREARARNAEVDKVIVKLTIVRQMCSLIRRKSDEANRALSFITRNIAYFLALPFDRSMRALRAAYHIVPACSNAIEDCVIDQLVDAIHDMVPTFEDPYEGEPVETLPEVDFFALEPLCYTLGALRHVPYVADKMKTIDNDFKRKMRCLIRSCHLKSAECKRVIEELGDVRMKSELNASVSASANVGLFAIEFLKSDVTQWEVKMNPSWKLYWNPMRELRPVPKIKTDRVKTN